MRALNDIADRKGLTIGLTAAEGNPKLIRLYLDLGFLIDGVPLDKTEQWLKNHEKQWQKNHDNDDDLWGVLMYRSPNVIRTKGSIIK